MMFHKFIRGWDESEYPALCSALELRLGLKNRLLGFFSYSSRNDVCLDTEMRLRLIFRTLTWDFAGSDYAHRAVRTHVSFIATFYRAC